MQTMSQNVNTEGLLRFHFILLSNQFLMDEVIQIKYIKSLYFVS